MKYDFVHIFHALSANFAVKNTLVNPSIFHFLSLILDNFFIFYPVILMAFLVQFLIFPPKNSWKPKNGVNTALSPLYKELWVIFGFLKVRNRIYYCKFGGPIKNILENCYTQERENLDKISYYIVQSIVLPLRWSTILSRFFTLFMPFLGLKIH